MNSNIIHITVQAKDLDNLYKAGERIVFVMRFKEQTKSMVAFVPERVFEHNELVWNSDDRLYVSENRNVGDQVEVITSKEIDYCEQYTYANGEFDYVKIENYTMESNSCEITNGSKDSGSLMFGWAKDMEFNGDKYKNVPLNAKIIPYNHSRVMTPIEHIDIFMQSDIETGTIINHIPSNSLSIEYSRYGGKRTITYESSSGSFVLV